MPLGPSRQCPPEPKRRRNIPLICEPHGGGSSDSFLTSDKGKLTDNRELNFDVRGPTSLPQEPEAQDDGPSFDDGEAIEDRIAGKSDYQYSASKHADKCVAKLRQVSDTKFYSNLVFLSILRPIRGPHERRSKDMEFVNIEDPTLSPRARR